MLPLPVLEPGWAHQLNAQFSQPYFQQLQQFLAQEYAANQTIYPEQAHIFRAFQLTPFEQVKVVILGQDPYHGAKQAHGLAFSVATGMPIPPSLQNIFKELHADLGCPIPRHGNLMHWARQGLLLLNTVLTVQAGQAHSHRERGWEQFTDHAITALSTHSPHPLVFLLWGSPAQTKKRLIDARHTILTAPHPSPLSAHRGFLGCRHFSKTNQFLIKQGQKPIDW